MRHKFLVLIVKELLKSAYIYGSYRKINTGLSLFLDHPVLMSVAHSSVSVGRRFWCPCGTSRVSSDGFYMLLVFAYCNKNKICNVTCICAVI